MSESIAASADRDPTDVLEAFGNVVFPSDPETVADAILAHGGASVARAIDFTVQVQQWAGALRTELERKATVEQLGEAAPPNAPRYGLWTPVQRGKDRE
jgi:hypothetical protein